jgi:hypothetical protein
VVQSQRDANNFSVLDLETYGAQSSRESTERHSWQTPTAKMCLYGCEKRHGLNL